MGEGSRVGKRSSLYDPLGLIDPFLGRLVFDSKTSIVCHCCKVAMTSSGIVCSSYVICTVSFLKATSLVLASQ